MLSINTFDYLFMYVTPPPFVTNDPLGQGERETIRERGHRQRQAQTGRDKKRERKQVKEKKARKHC